ncbi:hypothetical protein J1605_005175 [Eschrichtius robustus]|uniref:Uncharacterized protein n=1 Tax=Eschrichtius robustus TaxID=9764 RepID=A0AB34HBH4_ESCRO|nr:hypothetical protein J1605_005175 [Eschrichtius robustus]
MEDFPTRHHRQQDRQQVSSSPSSPHALSRPKQMPPRKDTVLNIFVVHVLHFPAEPAFTSKLDTTVATRLATGPGSRLMPSKAPSAGATGVVNNEPSQVPAQTTANAPEHTPSASQDPPG